jgi:hypothetical protein
MKTIRFFFIAAIAAMLGACAAPVKVYTVDGITIHENDLKPCANGASGCTMMASQCGHSDVYFSEFDPAIFDHEFTFHAKNCGKHTEPWRPVGNGFAYAIVTDAGKNKDWAVGDCMIRMDAGPVRHCDANVLRMIAAQ